MRSVRLNQQVLQVDEVPNPRNPRDDELIVKVAASSVNGTDLGIARGDMAILKLQRKPIVMGFELAGVVVGCGPAVTAFQPGDRVLALLDHSGGGQSDLALVPQSEAALIPDDVTEAQAGALPLAGLTALQALRGRAGIHALRAPRVLINGAAGGIGSFAVQLAKTFGAHVTAIATASRADYLTGLGADEVLDRNDDDAFAGLDRWDIVLDVPGRLGFDEVRSSLGVDGVMVSTHPISPDAIRMLAAGPFRPSGPRFATIMTKRSGQDLAYLCRLVASGSIVVPIDRTYPLEEIAAAHAYAQGGSVQGKVAISL